MLRQHQLQPTGYNEVLIDAPRWIHGLPDTLEAIFFVRGGPGEETARDTHRRFLADFPQARGRVPLVSIDVADVHEAVRDAGG